MGQIQSKISVGFDTDVIYWSDIVQTMLIHITDLYSSLQFALDHDCTAW